MAKEKVIIVGVNSIGEAITTCTTLKTDAQLQKFMLKKHDCTDFIVIYEEQVMELQDALEMFHKEN